MTPSMREYLAEIYRLQLYNNGKDARSVDITRQLNVSAAAVARMVNRLIEKKLVTQDPYGGVSVTKTGKYIAAEGLRWLRVLEVFASEQLGFDFDNLQKKSRLMMRGVDEEIIGRLFVTLGRPRYCPHGEFIPSAGKLVPMDDDRSFHAISVVGSSGVISRIRTHDKKRLDYLHQIGAVPGATYKLLNRPMLGGPPTFEINGKRWLLGGGLDRQLWGIPDEDNWESDIAILGRFALRDIHPDIENLD